MSARARVVLIGATGVFGRHLAGHLARMGGIDLVGTSRSFDKAAALKVCTPYALDHRAGLAAALAALEPWLVIDASGPFQSAGHDVPRAALEAGAHVIDIADARGYLLGYGAALDALARAKGLVALAGASSTPALSSAAAIALTEGWSRIDSIDIAIAPGGRSEVGRAVIEAILSYAGRPVPEWRDGRLQAATGWGAMRRLAMPGLGVRKVSPVETVDAELLPGILGVRDRVTFSAGLESQIEQASLVALAYLRRRNLLGDARPAIPALLALRRVTSLPMSDRGGMLVEARGLDGSGRAVAAQWSLLAEKGDGPHVPVLPALAAVRALLAGALAPGARVCAGDLPLAAIEREMQPLAISTRRSLEQMPALRPARHVLLK